MDYPIYKRNNDGTQLYKILSLKKVITLINDPNLGVGFAVMDGSSLIPVQSIIDNFDLCTEKEFTDALPVVVSFLNKELIVFNIDLKW